MDVLDTLRILCRQSRRGRHSIAAMSGNDLLVGLEAAVQFSAQSRKHCNFHLTYAPPELSEPAMTNTRFLFIDLIARCKYSSS